MIVAAVVAVAASAAGNRDTGFGNGGTVTTAIGRSSGVRALVLQPDGKLVAAGGSPSTYNGGSIEAGFALARYDKNGRLDK